MDKYEMKKKFDKENPNYGRIIHKNRKIPITLNKIKTVIRLFPTETNLFISKKIGLTEGQTNLIITELRKSGIKLPKKTTYSVSFQVKNLIKQLK